ncbi:Uncharacterised protein [Streptococcus dysgalactiae subsp. equisimilis]|nr:Uncharacterised protein [Streptococcus dysgalactiae subsp. equisimilis]
MASVRGSRRAGAERRAAAKETEIVMERKALDQDPVRLPRRTSGCHDGARGAVSSLAGIRACSASSAAFPGTCFRAPSGELTEVAPVRTPSAGPLRGQRRWLRCSAREHRDSCFPFNCAARTAARATTRRILRMP